MTHQQALDGLASERYRLDEMNEVERFEFEEHYFDCAECAEDVRLGDMIRQEARHAGPAVAANPQAGRPDVVLTSAKWWRRPVVAALLERVAEELVAGPDRHRDRSGQEHHRLTARAADTGCAIGDEDDVLRSGIGDGERLARNERGAEQIEVVQPRR